MNKILIEGRLTKDPELKQTNNGTHFCNFAIAVNDGSKENKKTFFFNCNAWKGVADRICQYFTKGNAISVEGKLIQNSYQAKDGTNRQSVEILVQSVSYPLGSYRPNTQPAPQAAQTNAYQPQQPAPAPVAPAAPAVAPTPVAPVPQTPAAPAPAAPPAQEMYDVEGFEEFEDFDLPF